MIMKAPEFRDNLPNSDPSPNPYDRQHPDFHSQQHVHDRPRLATRYGEDRTRIAAKLLLTLRGTPTRYYGDELG